jgi:hypothetical protein
MSRRQSPPEPAPEVPTVTQAGSWIWDGANLTEGEEAPAAFPALPAATTEPTTTTPEEAQP